MGKLMLVTALAIAGVLLTIPLPVVSSDDGLTDQQDILDVNPCNTTFNGTGTFSLPAKLPKGLCVITVQRNDSATSSSYTTLHFTVLNLKANDSLVIYDGNASVADNQVANMTGMRGSFTVVVNSTMAYLYVDITADNSSSQLVATYSSSGCQINETVSSAAYVQSPLYLPARMDFMCAYTISSADNSSSSQLALSFNDMSLPNATLNITSAQGQVLTVSGSSLPPDVYSNGALQMVLSVQNVNVSQKFSASLAPITLSTDCGVTKEINGSGMVNIIVPTLHPLSYDCRVTLKATTGKSLLLNITSLQLTSGGDRVMIVDGPSLGSPVLASLTNAAAGYLVLSSGQQVIVRLVVDELIGQRQLDIAVTELATSNHLRNSGSFSLLPPAVGTQTDRYFLLEAAAKSRVLFNLGAENSTEKYDYTVRVYDGPQTSSPILVTFSSKVRFPVMSTGNVLLVVAELTNTSQGLDAAFTTAASGCDQVTSANQGSFQVMTPPSLPAACRWTITGQPQSDATIMLDVTMAKLEKDAKVSVYSGVAESGGSLVAQLSASNTQPGTILPSVAIPLSQWAQLVFSGGNITNLTSVVQASFRVVDTLCGGQIQGVHGHIKSPGFPNLYPLNSVCKWTLPPSAPGRVLFFDFPQFQLAQNHSLQFSEQLNESSSRVLGTFQGAGAVADFIYTSNLTNALTFSTQAKAGAAVSNQVAQGFDVEYWVLDCGGNFTVDSANFSTPVANSSLCVWIVTMPAQGKDDSVNIVKLHMHVEATGTPALKDIVKVYDGNSLRATPINIPFSSGKTSDVLSRFNSVVIVFNNTAPASGDASSGVSLQVTYSIFNCAKKNQCRNGICLHPEWLCNGKDDCGDNTDEQNCISPPAPIPAPSTGVKPYVVAILFFLGLAVGIIVAVLLPRIVRRFRSHRYTAFQNEPALA